MKKVLILLLFVSMRVFADDPNLDTSTNIITFPRLTVDNSSVLTNVQLLLNLDGTWEVLENEPENTNASTTNWDGRLVTNGVFIGCNAQFIAVLTLNGNQFAGTGTLDGNCFGFESGVINGDVNGSEVSFELTSNDSRTIHFIGVLSGDYLNLSGSYTWPSQNDAGTWSLSFQ